MSNWRPYSQMAGGREPIFIMTLRKTRVAGKHAAPAFRKNDKNGFPTARYVTAQSREADNSQNQNSEVVGKRRPVGVALLEERIAALKSLIGAIGEARGLAREELQPDHAVIGRIERIFQHANRGR